MTQMGTLFISYAEILFLLVSICAMVIIFIKARKKRDKLLWAGRALVIPLIVLNAAINMFVTFTSGISNTYNYQLMLGIGDFFMLLASIFFLVLILAKRRLVKFL